MRRRWERQKHLRRRSKHTQHGLVVLRDCPSHQHDEKPTLRPLTMWYHTDDPPKSTWKSV